jgi:hypothetical protein
MAGVGLSGKITPLNGGNFPVFEDINGQGGYRTVATIAERNLITTTGGLFLKRGMLVYVEATQCIYILNVDLLTWTFLAPSPALQLQSAWEVNQASGNDTNTGLPGSPLATTEELSQRLCPFGRTCIIRQNVTISIGAGNYGSLDLSVGIAEPLTGLTFNINCAFTAVSDTLTSVINTVPGVSQGRITVASGPFTTRQRIRSTSGSNIGAITYTTGTLNSPTDAFVKTWYPSADNLNAVNITNGTTINRETLLVTFARVSIKTVIKGGITLRLRDCIIPNGIVFQNPQGSSACLIEGCEIVGRINGNVRFLNTKLTNVGFVAFPLAAGSPTIAGCLVTGSGSAVIACRMGVNVSNCFDAAAISISGGGAIESAGAGGGGASEWSNGAGLTAITLNPGGDLRWTSSPLFGFGTPYDKGFVLESGAQVIVNAIASVQIPSTQNVVMTGQNVTYAQLPRTYPRAACTFAINPDITAVAQTT